MRGLRWILTLVAAVAGAMAVVPAAASGDAGATGGAAGRDFGQHVVVCAQTMGFTGQHNPGMHRGFAGWDPSHVC